MGSFVCVKFVCALGGTPSGGCPALSGGALALGVGHRIPHGEAVVNVLRVRSTVLERFDRALDEYAVLATLVCAKRHSAHEDFRLKLLHFWRCERFDAVAVDRGEHFCFVASDQVAQCAENKCDVHDGSSRVKRTVRFQQPKRYTSRFVIATLSARFLF